jgi:putative ABC transport system permease protein
MLMNRTDPLLYLPPQSFFSPTLIARIARPDAALPAIRGIVQDMDAAIPPLQISSVADDMARSLATTRFTMLMLVVFTGIAVLLAAVGLYGVMAYTVAQRSREIGIRIALGATSSRVARGVVGRGAALAAVGLALGLIASHWGVRLVSNMLSGVTTADPWSFAAAAGVLLLTAVVACVAPMRRAARVDPMVAMRGEG